MTARAAGRHGSSARFVIELPVRTPASETSAAPRTAAPTVPVGPKTILVVDDERDVAAVIAEETFYAELGRRFPQLRSA